MPETGTAPIVNQKRWKRIVASWIACQCAEEGTPAYEANTWAVDLVLRWARKKPERLWSFILSVIDRDVSDGVMRMMASSLLEDLLAEWGPYYIDNVEELAMRHNRFKAALDCVQRQDIAQDVWSRLRVLVEKKGIPKRIPVARIEDYYTEYIGSCDSGHKQFWGQVCSSLGGEAYDADKWESQRRWYTIMHIFDAATGKHIETKNWFAGLSADGEDLVIKRARAKLQDYIQGLGEVVYEDIAVSLFHVEIDNDVFGLVDASKREWLGDLVLMLPEGLAFSSPWDGNYDV